MNPQDRREFTPGPELDQFGEATVMRAFFDSGAARFILNDPEKRYVYVNRFVAETRRRADLIRRGTADLIPGPECQLKEGCVRW